jgi:hypothetical protein
MYRNFLEPELEELVITENSTEWVEIANEIGAEGQVKLVKKADGTESNPIPYMPINKKWQKIFRTICPEVVEFSKYNKSTIPLDGLRDIRTCLLNKFFDTIEIWHSDVAPDPFIVGVVGKNWDRQHFLIGQFGDELLPFEMLEAKAVKKLTEGLKNQAKAILNNVDGLIHDYLETHNAPDISMNKIHGYLH